MEKRITELLDKTAAAYPDKIAFATEENVFTFDRLCAEAKAVGTRLVKSGYSGGAAAVLMDREPECIAAMMGVVYGGCFYSVLDGDMPAKRMMLILDTLQPHAIIADASHMDKAKEIAGDSIEVIPYEEAIKTPVNQVLLDNALKERDINDIACIFFTSGSTGVPKGVAISHRAVIHYLNFIGSSEDYDITSETIYANQAPIYFVMSIFEIFTTITFGCTCYIVPKKKFSFPVPLLEWLKERHVNTLYWVPSVLCMVANFRALPEVHLDDLKLVMFSAEVMPSKQYNMWHREYPDVTFINIYGPTEMTDIAAYYVVNREIADTESLPVGIAATHMKLLVMGDDGKEVPKGEMGELCGVSVSLADGYYRDPERTAQVFTPNPLDPSEIMYHTGDLVKVDERGDFIFMGRKDFQIKHLGNRIELGEIETAVSSLDGVDRNCCLFDSKRDKIILIYTGKKDGDIICEELKELLPYYMIPNRTEQLDVMPLNLNGKIDRAGLKEIYL